MTVYDPRMMRLMMTSSAQAIRDVADHLEHRVQALDRAMAGSRVVSPFTQDRRQQLAAAASVLRQEAIQVETGAEDVIGPDLDDESPAVDLSRALGLVPGPSEDS